jgi:hypothetical protein
VRNRLSSPIAWLLGAALLLVSGVFLWLSGSAVVIDDTGGVTSAFATNGHGQYQRLHRLWKGRFYAIPRLEGTIEVRCENGVRKRWGYVTPNMHATIRIVGNTPCARIVNR